MPSTETPTKKIYSGETSVWNVFREGSKFFMNEGGVHKTLQHLAKALSEANIDYAVVGGMALVAHGVRRFTEDVDLLLTPEGLREFRSRFIGRGYLPAFSTARKSFKDTETGVKIEILTTGEYPGDGKPKAVSFPDPADVQVERDGLWVISLEKLVELKLASGQSAPHRLRDLSDVQDLIATLDLNESFADLLDESVQNEYRRLWKFAQQTGAGPQERE